MCTADRGKACKWAPLKLSFEEDVWDEILTRWTAAVRILRGTSGRLGICMSPVCYASRMASTDAFASIMSDEL